MLFCKIIAVSFLTVGFIVLGSFSLEYVEKSDAYQDRILRKLAAMSDVIQGSLKEMMNAEVREEYDELMKSIENLGGEPLQQHSSAIPCSTCIATLGALIGLLRGGATYEDVKPIAMPICREIASADGYNPEILCNPIMDTYGPHVEAVLKATNKNARYICTFYDTCPGRELLIGPYDKILSTPNRSEIKNGSPSVEKIDGKAKRDSYKKNTLRLLHFTDLHADPYYAPGHPTECDMPLCCRADSRGTGVSMRLGDYSCNIAYETVDHAMEFILYNLAPDMIIYTGDTFQHTVWNQPQNETIETSRWLTDKLWHYFPGIPSFAALGNHDMSPTNMWHVSRPEMTELNAATFEHWQRLSKFTAEQEETMMKGNYFSISPFRGLRIIAYNTEYSVTENFYALLTFEEPEYAEMLQWMDDSLSAARQNNEKVIMMAHHATGGLGKVPGYTEFIIDLQVKYADVIILHLFGHNHDDKFSSVRDRITGEAKGVQMSVASLTSYTDVNPSFRIIHLDPVTYLPLDMDTYHLNLRTEGNSDEPVIKLTYKTSTDYGMEDLTAASFEQLYDRLETDDDLLREFRANMYTRTGTEGSCNDRCRAFLLCDLRHADYDGRQKCRSSIP